MTPAAAAGGRRARTPRASRLAHRRALARAAGGIQRPGRRAPQQQRAPPARTGDVDHGGAAGARAAGARCSRRSTRTWSSSFSRSRRTSTRRTARCSGSWRCRRTGHQRRRRRTAAPLRDDAGARGPVRGAGARARRGAPGDAIAVATLYQATFTLKRELEAAARTLDAERAHRRRGCSAARRCRPARGPAATGGTPSGGRALDSWKYVGFEDRFRGPRDEIRQRQADYVPEFAGARDVLDVGCGRGEFLDLLREAGVRARGLDLNHEMVEVCRARGLVADETDVLSFLLATGDGIARRPVRRPGHRASRARVPDAHARGRLSRAPARLAHRARNDQPDVLDRVLRELHPRPDARAPDSSRDAAVSC